MNFFFRRVILSHAGAMSFLNVPATSNVFKIGPMESLSTGAPSDSRPEEMPKPVADFLEKYSRSELIDLVVRTRPFGLGFSTPVTGMPPRVLAGILAHLASNVEYDSKWDPNGPPEISSDCWACGAKSAYKCGRCMEARYCSAICQKRDYPLHKKCCPGRG